MQVVIVNRLLNWLCQWLSACTKPGTTALPFEFVSGLTRSRSELLIENALLRQQLIILKRQGKRPQFSWRERAILVFLASRLPHWRQRLLIVQPVTLFRWHRDLFRFVWRRKAPPKRPPGRPKVDRAVIALLQQMTAENHTWGARRIQCELRKLSVRAARSTVQHDLRRLRPLYVVGANGTPEGFCEEILCPSIAQNLGPLSLQQVLDAALP